MTIGENIRKIRKSKGLTMKDIASKLEMTEQAISQYERNIRTPNTKLIIKISNILNVSPQEIDPELPIWKEFDEKFDVERLAKDAKEIANLNKNHQKILKEFTEEMKNESNVEDIIKSKSMKDIDKEYNELKIKQNSFLHKLEFFARAMREFNEFERDIIGELTEMYSNMIYDKRYDVNKLDEEQYSRLRQNIRNSIKESFEKFENK